MPLVAVIFQKTSAASSRLILLSTGFASWIFNKMSPILAFRIFLANVLFGCLGAAPSNESVIQLMRSKRSSGCDQGCGIANNQAQQPLIINGQDVWPVNKYPWVVALADARTSEIFCGGSIVNEKFILTAAHCLRKRGGEILNELGNGRCTTSSGEDNCFANPEDLVILFTDGTRGTVAQLYTEPNFLPSMPFINDVGLIQLSEPVECDDFKSPICLPGAKRTIMEHVGTRMIITGYGIVDLEKMQDSEGHLKEVQITVADPNDCAMLGAMPSVGETTYCVQTKGKSSPCFGDSGGNLFAREGNNNYVFGVATAVISPVCEPGVPTIYTAVAPYMDWILGTISQDY